MPTLLYRGTGLVKGKSFNNWRPVGPVLPSVKIYSKREVDEILFIDLNASELGHQPNYALVSMVASHCSMPLAVGGGINSVETIQNLLLTGADKIVLNSVIYENPGLVEAAANRFGSQCLIGSIDVKTSKRNDWTCFSHGGRVCEQQSLSYCAKNLENLGVGEILVCSIDKDGSLQGFDTEMVKEVVSTVDLPVIASGGAGEPQHFVDVIANAGASAVAASSIFHFTQHTPSVIKKICLENGINVRVPSKNLTKLF